MGNQIKVAGSTNATPDSFTWSNQYGGTWAAAADWTDISSGTTASAAPGAANAVTITNASTNFLNIAGSGAAAQLTMAGDVLLWGTVSVGGTINVISNGNYASGDLELDGGVLTGAALNVQQGATLEVGDSSQLTVHGATTLGGGLLTATDNSIVQFGSLVANTDNILAVDGVSSIEIGTTGSAALGAVTIDKGQDAILAGIVEGNLVVNGTVDVAAGEGLTVDVQDSFGSAQTISGSGLIRLSESSIVTLGVTDSAAIEFNAPGGRLTLDAIPSGTISGFGGTDVIEISTGTSGGLPFNSPTSTATPLGPITGLRVTETSSKSTLTLLDGTKTVGTLTLSGNYTTSLFHLSHDSAGDGLITLQTIGVAPTVPSVILGTAGVDYLNAIANNETLTGLGGSDTLNPGTFTGIDFKDTTADLNSSTIDSFGTTDVIDLTDMSSAKATATYTPASFLMMPPYTYSPPSFIVTDGTHTATINMQNFTTLTNGYFAVSSDGASGTDVRYVVINTDAYKFSGASGGSFATASNWTDTTTGSVATAAPSSTNSVTIAAPLTGVTTVTGNGAAASLTTTGDVVIQGSIAVASGTLTGTGILTQSGTLTLNSGAVLTLPASGSAQGGALIGGTVEVSGTSTLQGAGGVTFTQSGAAVYATAGGTVQFAAVNAPASPFSLPGFPGLGSPTYNASILAVDSTSSIEIGSAGKAAKGALTVDTGLTVDLAGTIEGSVVLGGTLVTAGTLLAIGGYGTTAASVTGAGTLAFGGSNDTIRLSGSDTAAIRMAGTNDTLALGTIVPTGTITGFGTTDLITLTEAVTGLTYSQGTNSGALILQNGTSNIGTIVLAGTYSANQFQVQTIGTQAASATIQYVAANYDSYQFSNPSGGSYAVASNWTDTVTGKTAAIAPGITNNVTIAGASTGFTTITGNGSAETLIMTGDVLVQGSIAVGNPNGFSFSTLAQSGTLELNNGAVMTLAASASASIGGLVEVSGANALLGAGGVMLSQSSAALEAIGGGTVQLGSLSSFGYYSGPNQQVPALVVDALSSIEIGSAGNAGKGALTVDAGVTATVGGTIEGKVVLNGTLDATGTLDISGYGTAAASVTGSGTIVVAAGETLQLNGSDTAAISLTGTNDLLAFGTILPTGTISNFGAGDFISVAETVTGLTYSQGANSGTLTLMNGTVAVGKLVLAGTYNASQFQLEPASGNQSSVLVCVPAPSTVTGYQVSVNNHTYSWTATGGGDWTNPANWSDMTSNGTVTASPGASNTVDIDISETTGQIITGSGSAATLSVNLTNFLSKYSLPLIFTGNINVGGAFTETASGTYVELANGAKFNVGNLSTYGELQIAGGSTLTASGLSAQNYLYSTVNVVGGSSLKLYSEATVDGTLAADASSTIEFGTAGTASAGGITIDPGATANLEYGTIAANITDNGTIDIYSSLTIGGYAGATGTITGAGTIVLNFGTLTLEAADAVPISMSNSVLELAGPLPTGAINGFGTGSRIQVDRTVTGVSYAASAIATQGGTLSLLDGATKVGTLTLSSGFANELIEADVSAATGVATLTAVTLPTVGTSSTPATGKDAYVWSGSAGAWSSAANWTDTTTNSAATFVPGASTSVTIAGTPQTVIDGTGTAGTLNVGGTILLAAANLNVAGQLSSVTSGPPVKLALTDGAKLTSAAATVFGEIEIGGASTVTVAGTANLTNGTLLAVDGSAAHLGSLAGTQDVIAVDANSVLTVGTVATPTQGALTEAAGSILALSGAIYGNVVANGQLSVAGGGTLLIDLSDIGGYDPYETRSSITGTGTLTINENSMLGLGAADSAAIAFAGPSGTLTVAALPSGHISGFTGGDSIVVEQPVTSLNYAQSTATAGTLTLMNGTATVGSLSLAGTYSSTAFQVAAGSTSGTAVITLQSIGLLQPTLIQGTAAADLLSATANGQTLTGLGGGDTLNAAGFTGIDFKDLTANLNGSTILNFSSSDMLDFTDMTSTSAKVTFGNGVLAVTDGTHSASINLGYSNPSGSFHVSSDGATGTKLTWS